MRALDVVTRSLSWTKLLAIVCLQKLDKIVRQKQRHRLRCAAARNWAHVYSTSSTLFPSQQCSIVYSLVSTFQTRSVCSHLESLYTVARLRLSGRSANVDTGSRRSLWQLCSLASHSYSAFARSQSRFRARSYTRILQSWTKPALLPVAILYSK